jgi:hypothetical protein
MSFDEIVFRATGYQVHIVKILELTISVKESIPVETEFNIPDHGVIQDEL